VLGALAGCGAEASKEKKLRSPAFEVETDAVILARRGKQIGYMKNTVDYDKFLELVRRTGRKGETPRTPNKRRKYGRRQWDGLVRSWKQRLHRAVNGEVMEGEDEADVEFQRLYDSEFQQPGGEGPPACQFEEIYEELASGAPGSSWAEEMGGLAGPLQGARGRRVS
jgi:hypothetical protein